MQTLNKRIMELEAIKTEKAPLYLWLDVSEGETTEQAKQRLQDRGNFTKGQKVVFVRWSATTKTDNTKEQ